MNLKIRDYAEILGGIVLYILMFVLAISIVVIFARFAWLLMTAKACLSV
jgi:hypothetical protein